MDEYVERLARQYLARFLCGQIAFVDPYRLVDDGRKRAGILKNLRRAGYILENGKIDDSIMNAVAEARPDLVTHHKRSGTPNVYFWSLALAEQKFVCNHPDLYGFRGPEDRIQFFGDVDVYALDSLTLIDAPLRKHLEHSRKFAELSAGRLAWGLEMLGVLPRDVAARIPVGGTDPLCFTTHPEQWKEESIALQDKLKARIRGDNELLSALLLLTSAMQTYGGWEKFLQDYQVKINEELGNDKSELHQSAKESP